MSRTQQQKQKDANKGKFTEWQMSEPHRGRVQRVPAALERARRTGYDSVLPPTMHWVEATSTTFLSAQFPESYIEQHYKVVSADELVDAVLAFCKDEDVSFYGFVIETNVKSGPAVDDPVDAPGLVALHLKGADLAKDTRAQWMQLFKKAKVPHLVDCRIFMPGKLYKPFEGSIFDFLGTALGSLTHLTLQLAFYDKEGLEKFLCSDGAASLISLELQTNSQVTKNVANALSRRNAHRLPNLRKLCLRLKKDSVDELFDALCKRYDLGAKQPLQVELRSDISDKIYHKARTMGITFDEPSVFR
ncbi:uncharacterized protein SCHCODRAFT_02700226 [Schizophyllum commune H4-8]|uniref:Uncharacterized protein n=1 Tax=Schizophyllum commune (strain H4-8 / FGSC 9210) TaxID=578458 RepID=D8PQH9_SCHCM|nr:uncharacterized protein SCHCODRAFT_02700226 [Schizophyllum commune H4-8]KAI5893622.1 hypothetical protein SCHCODRAFT_02700226 [Schizophyllum commune H4-8]